MLLKIRIQYAPSSLFNTFISFPMLHFFLFIFINLKRYFLQIFCFSALLFHRDFHPRLIWSYLREAQNIYLPFVLGGVCSSGRKKNFDSFRKNIIDSEMVVWIITNKTFDYIFSVKRRDHAFSLEWLLPWEISIRDKKNWVQKTLGLFKTYTICGILCNWCGQSYIKIHHLIYDVFRLLQKIRYICQQFSIQKNVMFTLWIY